MQQKIKTGKHTDANLAVLCSYIVWEEEIDRKKQFRTGSGMSGKTLHQSDC
jgi:hypothetical protein